MKLLISSQTLMFSQMNGLISMFIIMSLRKMHPIKICGSVSQVVPVRVKEFTLQTIFMILAELISE